MASGNAAYLKAEKAFPLEIGPREYVKPGEKQLLVRNRAVAINPVDVAMQAQAIIPLQYPFVEGIDCAGEVVEVGSRVTRFALGDRVLAHCTAFDERVNEQGAFQEYVVVYEHMTAQIPPGMAFERAAVVPLALSTAASGMHQAHMLGVPRPRVDPTPAGKTLLVWGAASSVGASAVQLAVAAGYDVIATASPRNFDFVRKVGASQVFDYRSDNIAEELVQAFKGKTSGGIFDAIGKDGVLQTCIDIADRVGGNKFISTAWFLSGEEKFPDGVSAKFILGSELKVNDLGKAIYQDFLPQALARGKFLPLPEPQVVGHGLESIQKAFDTYSAGGISATKLVVTL